MKTNGRLINHRNIHKLSHSCNIYYSHGEHEHELFLLVRKLLILSILFHFHRSPTYANMSYSLPYDIHVRFSLSFNGCVFNTVSPSNCFHDEIIISLECVDPHVSPTDPRQISFAVDSTQELSFRVLATFTKCFSQPNRCKIHIPTGSLVLMCLSTLLMCLKAFIRSCLVDIYSAKS